MKRLYFAAAALLASTAVSSAAMAADEAKAEGKPAAAASPGEGPDRIFKPQTITTTGSVTVGGKALSYRAVAGTFVVHPRGWDDTSWREAAAIPGADKPKDLPMAEASMFYTAYFRDGGGNRPVVFIYNGGPGSATLWLHMGAFGPRRVVVREGDKTPPAPYPIVNNPHTLLDVADLVFIDAPGAGFSRIAGKDKEKAFWGVDADAYAFGEFIKTFLNTYQRWNSPKYIFGESYGTTRSAVLANVLGESSVDLNGVILLSTILNFGLDIDGPASNPGLDTAYVTGLPTMAATAWYHNRLPGGRPGELEPFLREVEQFALTDYASALMQGSRLDAATRQKIAERLSAYTGLSPDYILKSNLRVSGGQFSQQLQLSSGLTTGRIDTRFSGPAIDVLSKEPDYDPNLSGIGAAYIAAWNDYARGTLKFPGENGFKIFAGVGGKWDMAHAQPGRRASSGEATNVMPDLAVAMKENPTLKVLNMGGYYDLATPYFQGHYELDHLPIPDSLRGNIEHKFWPAGHMVYLNENTLDELHDTAADFIRRTSR